MWTNIGIYWKWLHVLCVKEMCNMSELRKHQIHMVYMEILYRRNQGSLIPLMHQALFSIYNMLCILILYYIL